MNERIKELKFQAAAQVSPLLEGSEWQRVFTEKFAELIVQECAELVEYNSKGAGRDIREHFGVTE